MRWGLIGVLMAVAVVAIGAYAIGAGKSSKNLVLCANKKSGDVSLATAKGKCAKGERKLTVAKEGPVGPVGPAGPAGVAPSSALEPVNLVKLAADCVANPGSFCASNPTLGHRWENLYDGGAAEPPLSGYYKDLGGVVHLVGFANFNMGGGGTGGASKTVFYLPPGFRPGQGVATFVDQPCGGKAQAVSVHGDGKVEIADSLGGCANFEGVSFHP